MVFFPLPSNASAIYILPHGGRDRDLFRLATYRQESGASKTEPGHPLGTILPRSPGSLLLSLLRAPGLVSIWILSDEEHFQASCT